jgi:hypothetical protein
MRAAPVLLVLPCLALAQEVRFEKRTLTKEFVAEGCAVADFNRDGHPDVAAGRFIWQGPDFAQRVAYTPERDNKSGPAKTPYNPETGYSDYFLQFAHDLTGDGWTDLLVFGLPGEPALLFVNPAGKPGDWARHALVDIADGESPALADINGDGWPEILVHTTLRGENGGRFGYFEVDRKNPLAKARFRAVSEPTRQAHKYTHGYGAGDVNADGRADILVKDGWYEQPADRAADAPWRFHPAKFGPGGAQMHVMDVNGDRRPDVITALQAHGYGLAWFEQLPDGAFREHRILGASAQEVLNGVSFTQPHAVELVDLDGDGLLDIVTGKRKWAHGTKNDPEPMAAPVLYGFLLSRDGQGGASYRPVKIDGDSGVGTQFWTGRIDGDARPDLALANKHGVFVFLRR